MPTCENFLRKKYAFFLRQIYWEMQDGRLASGDDITAIVVNLQEARRLVKKTTK